MAQAMGAIGLGASLAGGIVQGFAANSAGKSKASMYNYQAGIADMNSRVAKQNADYARRKGETEAMQFGIKARQQAGAIRAAQGAGGIDVGTGSNMDVQESQAETARMDIAQIRENAAKVAYDYDVQSKNFDAEAGLYRMSAKNAKKEGKLAMIGSFIGTAASVSDKWLRGSLSGMWGKQSIGGGMPWLSGEGDDYF